MKFAIPTENKILSDHFGHAEQFAFIETDSQTGQPGPVEYLTPPEHQTGVIPTWLIERKVDCVIAGGIGKKAQTILSQKGVRVLVGAPHLSPEELVCLFLDNRLTEVPNPCSHNEKKHSCSHKEK